MRTRLVFWGKSASNERVLMGFKLNEEDNTVDVYVFPESITTEEFSKQLQENWRSGKDLLFPEGFEQFKIPLTITGSLLPEGYTIERDDILRRAQTEWQFIILSSRLYQSYQEELAEFKEKFNQLTRFDPSLFDELKQFWSKVQDQVREKNLFKEHADSIRKHTDELFEDLKKLRRSLDQEFHQASEKHLQRFRESLEKIEQKVESGLSLQNIFQELKDLQKSFRNTSLTGEHRGQIWKKLDGLFKQVKEKKFGDASGGGKSDPLSRLQRRVEGLRDAIDKMDRSIKRDQKEFEFQTQRMEDSDGSLEAQLRAAKSKMIKDRIESKEEKLLEMQKTQKDLERRIDQIQRRKEQQKIEEKVKSEIKEKIAQEIKEAQKARGDNEAIQRAAEMLSTAIPAAVASEEEPITLVESIEEGIEDVVDTVKAVADVVEDKIRSFVDDWKGEKDEEE